LVCGIKEANQTGRVIKTMKLEQGQLWKQGANFYRIVHLERLAVEYKELKDATSLDGYHRGATKKDFCRLIKGATLVNPKGEKKANAAS
jgi:hypothetical protein